MVPLKLSYMVLFWNDKIVISQCDCMQSEIIISFNFCFNWLKFDEEPNNVFALTFWSNKNIIIVDRYGYYSKFKLWIFTTLMCMLLLYLIFMFPIFYLLENTSISFHLFNINNIIIRNINITHTKLVTNNNLTHEKLTFILWFLIQTLHNSSFIFFTSSNILLISLPPLPFLYLIQFY